MIAAPVDLDPYFARIGYDGPRAATLEVLTELHRLHPAAIAFENLDPFLGRPVPLDIEALQAKLVTGRRGGYCYEHNGLFKAVLTALGFTVTGLAARVRWGLPDDAPSRHRSHMALLVDLPEGRFLADVGFGGLVQTAPLRLKTGLAQETSLERFRIAAHGEGGFELQAELAADDWRPLHRFDLQPQWDVDYVPLNWFTATSPASIFTTSLIATRALPDRRLTLVGERYTERVHGGLPVERTLSSMAEIARVLRDRFGVEPPASLEQAASRLGL
jgi:N-hydroxyarylamine O-acetyltransferase